MLIGIAGNKKRNQGNIYISNENEIYKNGIPTKYIYHIIGKLENISACGIYTIPRNFSLHLKFYDASTSMEKNENLEVISTFNTHTFAEFELAKIYFNHYNTNIAYDIKFGNPFGEKTDISFSVRKTFSKKGYFKKILSKINKRFSNPILFDSWLQFTLIENV
jgi:D-mannonate dehydratase